MIKIGADWWYPATAKPQTIWSINGDLVSKGRISFPQETYILLAKDARLQFGTNRTFIGTNSKIMCFDSIIIGDNVRITWDCQIYDTSFHYEKVDGIMGRLTSPIVIGENVWVGNGTTITKGVTTPNWSIIGNRSLVNKNLEGYGEHCLFAGTPAKLKKKNVSLVFDVQKEEELDKKYLYNRNHL